MSQAPINVGIIGLGFMAATHIKAYREVPEANIHTICNPSGRCLDGDLTRVGGNIGANDPVKLDMSRVKATRDFNELLNNPEIQLIDICAPTALHPEMLEQALAAGKHVLCEKPLALDSNSAKEMLAASRKAKTFSMPAMCLRFWPEWAWLKNAVANNTYGKVYSARFRRVAEPPTWGTKHFANGQKSGGALLDLHIHDVDFINYVFGKPKTVFATGYTKYTGAIDHVVAQFTVASGAIIHAEGSWAMAPGFGFSMGYTVNFENATADYDIARGPENLLKLYQPGKAAEVVKCPGSDGYVGEIRHLIAAIQSGKAPSVVTMEDGVTSVEICEAEQESIQRGLPVNIA
ncbi:MAG: Gfo/Idh/MocA family protein [Verrucomicrobiota bacterium]